MGHEDKSLYIINTNGSQLRHITDLSVSSLGNVCWTKDNSEIVYIEDGTIYKTKIYGTQPEILYSEGDNDSNSYSINYDLACSPDGKWGVFMSHLDSRDWQYFNETPYEIRVIDLESGEIYLIASLENSDYEHAHWSK